jgi:hypothetical protein
MSDIECNADLGHHCDADDGDPCPSCAHARAEAEDYYRARYSTASLAERNPRKYAEEMAGAGRGHLLTDGEKERLR